MIPIVVIVQEDQIRDDGREGMKRNLEDFAFRHFDTEATIDWLVVPKGSGFTAAEPSTSAVVSIQANRRMCHAEREPLIKELRDLSMKHTDRTQHELVVSLRDPKLSGEV